MQLVARKWLLFCQVCMCTTRTFDRSPRLSIACLKFQLTQNSASSHALLHHPRNPRFHHLHLDDHWRRQICFSCLNQSDFLSSNLASSTPSWWNFPLNVYFAYGTLYSQIKTVDKFQIWSALSEHDGSHAICSSLFPGNEVRKEASADNIPRSVYTGHPGRILRPNHELKWFLEKGMHI